MAKTGKWDFWIDRGGTFTDIVAKTPDGALITHKLLSDNSEQYHDAALHGMRTLMGVDKHAPIPSDRINAVKMGTTVATNALLERAGDRTLFVTTRGFRDALRIGYQQRPNIFALEITRPALLYEDVVEVTERINAHGAVITPLDAEAARMDMQAAFDRGIRAVAICFVHGYRYTGHEARVAAIATEIGFAQVSVSHKVSPLMKYVSRGDTTVVDAYLSPILRRYIDQVDADLHTDNTDCRLMFMQSNGGLTDAHLFEGKDAILSGPAGGVVGMAQTGQQAGFDKIIGFDMGGTSTDVSHFKGDYERAFDTEVAGVRMRAPMMHIHTVAAGGGSILSYDGARMRVGPHSAGANPGPTAYRKGGPLTVTDANVMLGKLQPDLFPRVFGPKANAPLDAKAVHRAFTDLAQQIDPLRTPEEIADGFIAIAVENMAQAIKKISVAKGYDVSSYVLSCFGGAGAQHACLVADALNMQQVLIHPFASLLSAYGMGLADIRAHRETSIETTLTGATARDIRPTRQALERATFEEVNAQGIDANKITTICRWHLRYDGTDTPLIIDDAPYADLIAYFESQHRGQFGFTAPDKAIIVEALSVEAIGQTESAGQHVIPMQDDTGDAPKTVRLYSQGAWHEARVIKRSAMHVGDRFAGPALIIEPHSTIVVEEDWQAERSKDNNILLTRAVAATRAHAIGTSVDPVMLEIFNNLFMSIAEQMGVTLEKTAHSVNIKERLDFSCAIFDANGGLVANAPHMPVHLGSMGASVQTVMQQNPDMGPGDVFVLNAPYNGGTHLPDVTVIAPVYNAAGERLFFTAARGHHADIGGITPGSMPATSTSVEEEGILLDNVTLVKGGRFLEEDMRARLTSGPTPSRNPDQNIADLKAQVAACEKGAQELRKMVDAFGLDVVHAYMGHVQDNAEECVRRVIDVLSDSSFSVTMDNGAKICIAIRVDKKTRSAVIDFTGTSAARPNNFNAPSAVCRAAVLYVFRCMVADDIPLNEGCLKPLDLIIPEGCFLNPAYPSAVVAGNVETSQHITDALFGALGVMAAAQGTMNNLTFGNADVQYYETLCGGSGAGKDFDGTSAVHTHMTNSRLTDVEVLEWRFPVTLNRFAIRHGSGGAGAHAGGDGVIRELTFHDDVDVSLLSTRRHTQPFGLHGGEDGAHGVNYLRHANGVLRPLDGCATATLKAGDSIILETPGGGGFGKKV